VVYAAPYATHLLVTARSGGSQRDQGGVSLFLIPATLPGITRRDYPTVDGAAASEIYFENVALGADMLVGAAGVALPLIEQIVDEATAAVCAEACGLTRVLHATTLDYAKQRKQFGKPISEFQSLQHRMVDMFMEVEQAVSITLMATLKLDTPERATAVSAAKSKVGKACKFVGQNAVQIHGGIGISNELAVGHYFKRSTMIESQFGSVDHHLRRYERLAIG
jgi:alkylation response protein AidB-like acyl-CoA dehydrogenase